MSSLDTLLLIITAAIIVGLINHLLRIDPVVTKIVDVIITAALLLWLYLVVRDVRA